MNNQIPSWIPDACPKILGSLEQIQEIQCSLRAGLPERFEYSHVSQRQLNKATDSWIESGALSDEIVDTPMGKMRLQSRAISVDAAFARASIYNISRGKTLIQTQKDVTSRVILRLLHGARAALESGDCLVSFMCYRGVFEQVGHLACFVRDAAKLPSGEGFEESYKYLSDLIETLAPRLYGTRVGWNKIVEVENLQDLIKKNTTSYETDPKRIDNTSKSCLSGVDLVDKNVRGARAVYDIFCEFAHPNIGNLLVSTMDVIPEEGSDGVVRVHKTLHSGPPFSLMKDCSNLVAIIFEVVANVMVCSKKLLAECDREATRAQEAAKRVMPRFISKNKKIFDNYAACPCGSGEKVRFCCGRTTS
jgi:hypothetical protein